MRFGVYLDPATLPVVPRLFGRTRIVVSDASKNGVEMNVWPSSAGLLGNDATGDCVEVAMGQVSSCFAALDGEQIDISAATVTGDYSAITGYDPNNPASDQGTDMASAMSWWQKTGTSDTAGGRNRIGPYFSITPDQVELSTFMCGATVVGLGLPGNAEDVFLAERPWTLTPGMRAGDGHCVAIFGRNSQGLWISWTWGRWQGIADDYLRAFMDEGYAPVKMGQMPRGLDEVAVLADLVKYTGRQPTIA